MPICTTCEKKQEAIKVLFNQCKTQEERYEQIIELGRKAEAFPVKDKIPENVLEGCQSTMYLTARLENGCVFFSAASDALISAGLAALLVNVYSGETPESILKCPPTFLEDLGIAASLTPSRANGLHSIHLRMKQEALRLYMHQESLPADTSTEC